MSLEQTSRPRPFNCGFCKGNLKQPDVYLKCALEIATDGEGKLSQCNKSLPSKVYSDTSLLSHLRTDLTEMLLYFWPTVWSKVHQILIKSVYRPPRKGSSDSTVEGKIPKPKSKGRGLNDQQTRSFQEIRLGLLGELDTLAHGWSDPGKRKRNLCSQTEQEGISLQSSVKTFLPGFGNMLLKYCAIVHFWGGQLNMLWVILGT